MCESMKYPQIVGLQPIKIHLPNRPIPDIPVQIRISRSEADGVFADPPADLRVVPPVDVPLQASFRIKKLARVTKSRQRSRTQIRLAEGTVFQARNRLAVAANHFPYTAKMIAQNKAVIFAQQLILPRSPKIAVRHLPVFERQHHLPAIV